MTQPSLHPAVRPSQPARMTGRHLLSFDVEEYFQVEAAAAGIRSGEWDTLPQRLAPCVDRILELLERHRARATFFVLGWVARHERALVERIARAGHEIASHGMTHQMLTRLSPGQVRQELQDSRCLLEDISGRRVLGFRAPTFSIVQRTAWALEALVEAGYEYDSSIFPVRHDRYGMPQAPPMAHHACASGASILEIPPLTLRLGRANWPVGGGGYLRLLPVDLIGWAMKRFSSQGYPAMIYLHPWELDAEQPALPMRPLDRWRHRVNLRRTESKLAWLLERFAFASVSDCIDQLKISASRVHEYR